MSEVGAFQLIKQGNLRVEIHFAEALRATINMIIKYTVVSAYSGAFFLNSDGVVSSTRTMFVHKVHVCP
jgi:hypothetical protein